jgi:hypothetical protein
VELNLPLTLGGILLIILGLLLKSLVRTINDKVKIWDDHVRECAKKEGGELLISYRVQQLETTVMLNHSAVMTRLAEISGTGQFKTELGHTKTP